MLDRYKYYWHEPTKSFANRDFIEIETNGAEDGSVAGTIKIGQYYKDWFFVETSGPGYESRVFCSREYLEQLQNCLRILLGQDISDLNIKDERVK